MQERWVVPQVQVFDAARPIGYLGDLVAQAVFQEEMVPTWHEVV